MFDPVLVLDRAPRALRDAVLSVTRGRGPLGAVYDRLAHRFDPADVPDAPEAVLAQVRVLIGPANEAEQGYQWARALERNLSGVSARAMTGFDPRGYRVRTNLLVSEAVYLRSRAWHDVFERYLESLSHLVFESNLPVLGRRYRGDGVTEAQHFAARGVDGALLFHGSDIRSPRQHARESQWSPFTRAGLPVHLMEEKAERNRRRAVESGLPVFVSTPDLLRHAPGSRWCPIVVEPADWATDRARWPSSKRPVVVHAPSNPLLKGSDQIEPILRRLEAERLIEYRVVRGIPYADMPRMYAEADIVLDHFLIGNYSMVTIEALAAGCLVIGHVDEQTRAAVFDSTGLTVPVLEADVRTLDAVLREALKGGDVVRDLLARGRAFVKQVHDGRHSAEAMRGFLGVTG